jgi:hypothetical protein
MSKWIWHLKFFALLTMNEPIIVREGYTLLSIVLLIILIDPPEKVR